MITLIRGCLTVFAILLVVILTMAVIGIALPLLLPAALALLALI
jgi:hypothetical protein